MLIALILILVWVLGVSFFCALTEAVLLSLNPLALKVREKQGHETAGRWLAMKNNVERPISAILVFNTLATTGSATLAGAVFASVFGEQWLWLFSILITIAVLFCGELAPKIIGVHHAERLGPRLIGPLTWMMRLCHPLVIVMEKFCEKLKSGGDSTNRSDQIMDIITLVQAAKAEHVLHNREEIIIIHAATLSARRVRSVMVPRDAMRVFDQRKTLLENVAAAGDKLHRSYPVVTNGDLDSVQSYIRVRELFVQNLMAQGQAASTPDWTPLIRPVLRVEGTASLTHLLALFLEKREISALVQGKDGKIIGWITMDDVTEVLMGSRG